MRKTKIICTLGPATESEGVLREMIEAGANIFRLNMSHAPHDWVRQIVMPFAHDQLDNANRVVKLGVGRWIEPRAYRAGNVARVMTGMLGDEPMHRRCGEVKAKFAGVDGVGEACELIESMPTINALTPVREEMLGR